MDVRRAAEKLGVSMQIVYLLCARRKLRHSRVGLGRGKIVISDEAVTEYLKSREVGPQDAAPTPVRRRTPKLSCLRPPS